MTQKLAYTVAPDGTLSGFVRSTSCPLGKNFSIGKGSLFYNAAKEAIKAKDADKLLSSLDLDAAARERSRGKVTFSGGVIRYNGAPMHNSLTNRVLALIADDFDFQPLINFMDKLMKNPSQTAIDELYFFLEGNSLPITEEGNFLAYRRVDKDWMSMHPNPDGTRNRNMIGDEPSMPRGECDDQRNNTCSRGLHFASLSYIPHYGSDSNGDKTVVVEIDPADVIAIPSDYNNQKGRCCRYKVVAQHVDGERSDTLSKHAVYEVTTTGILPSGQKFTRGANGRFVKASQ